MLIVGQLERVAPCFNVIFYVVAQVQGKINSLKKKTGHFISGVFNSLDPFLLHYIMVEWLSFSFHQLFKLPQLNTFLWQILKLSL